MGLIHDDAVKLGVAKRENGTVIKTVRLAGHTVL